MLGKSCDWLYPVNLEFVLFFFLLGILLEEIVHKKEMLSLLSYERGKPSTDFDMKKQNKLCEVGK